MPVVGNNSYSFNVTDPQNWTSITVIAENQCRSTRIPVNFTASMHVISIYDFVDCFPTVECPTSTATGVTTPTGKSLLVCNDVCCECSLLNSSYNYSNITITI